MSKSEWHIAIIYLDKEFRGEGYGKEIVNKILSEIKNKGGKMVTLNVMDTQEIAIKMYEKLGFKTYRTNGPEYINGNKYPGDQWMFKNIE